MLPDQAGGAGHALHVEKLQRLLRVDGDALVHGAVAVVVVAVHAQEPAVLRVHDHQVAGVVLQGVLGHDHVVGDGLDLTGLAQVQVIFLTGDGVGAQQDLAVLLLVDLLQHLALAAAGSALVHEDDLVFIGALQHGRGGVVGDPALMLADIQEHGEHALLGGGTRIEVVGKDLMERVAALVDDDLLALKVGVPEGGRHIDDGAGVEMLGHVVDGHEALHVGQRQREEGRVDRADHQAVVAEVLAARLEGQQDELLIAEPGHRLLAELLERVAVALGKAGLVGGQIVADAHAVGIAAAHVVLHEVDDGAVLAADDLRLLDQTLALDGIADVIAGGVGRAVGHLGQLLDRLGVDQDAAFAQRVLEVLGENKAGKKLIGIQKNPSFL